MEKKSLNSVGQQFHQYKKKRFFCGILVTRSLVLFVMFCRSLFVLLFIFFWPFLVCSSSIYGFSLTLWYLQTLLSWTHWLQKWTRWKSRFWFGTATNMWRVKPFKVLLECNWEMRKFHQYENRNSYVVLFQYILSKCNNITDVQSKPITTNIVSSIPAQTRCTRYTIMW